MENRRPPRKNTYGQKSYHGRGGAGAPGRQSQQSRDIGNRPRRPNQDSSGNAGQTSRGDRDRYPPRQGGSFFKRDRFGPYQQDRYGKPLGKIGPGGRGARKRRTEEDRGEAGPPITSDLQVTDGKFRAKFLKNSLSPSAVPTGRKLREIMFKVISRRVRAGRFLDLGAGMGMVGIEAVSRGAMLATFVERSTKMCAFINKNLESLGIKDGHAECSTKEIVPFLKDAARRRRQWDLVFFGARATREPTDIYAYFERGVPLARGGLLMIEHESEREFPEKLGVLSRWRTISNNNSNITFYERK